MGAVNKMLVDWHGRPMVCWVVDAIQQAGLDPLVVLGHEAELVGAAVGCRTVFNPQFADGMGTSLACGVSASEASSAVLVAHADMPELQPLVVLQLTKMMLADDDIVVPMYADSEGEFGHPIVIGPAYRTDLLRLDGDVGAKQIIRSNLSHVKHLAVPGSFRDYDVITDSAAARRH